MVGLEKVHEIAARVARSYGLDVLAVEFRGGAGKQGRVLRITLDRSTGAAAHDEGVPQQAGVTLEDCANVSREVSTILDVEETVPGGDYVLEVSSPGLDRPLKRSEDYARFIGSQVKVMTREPVGVSATSKGNRHFEGRLESFSDGRLTLDLSIAGHKAGRRQAGAGKKIEIALDNVERANLVPEI